jgi:hypothetical protein
VAEPTKALHTALLARLQSILSVTVWDAVPQGTNYPYVTLDSMVSANEDFLNSRINTRFVYLGIWSRAYGQAEIMDIMSQIDAINEQPLALSTGSVVSVRVDNTRTVRDSDNLTYQGQVTLRIITQH